MAQVPIMKPAQEQKYNTRTGQIHKSRNNKYSEVKKTAM
jgi:hypothetical protein